MNGYAESFAQQVRETELQDFDGIEIINAADLLVRTPPPLDFVLDETLDVGDKMAVIGASKQRKSFFLQQMSISLVSGRDFLNWRVPKRRKVLYVQFEIRGHHLHRRLLKLAAGMGITPDDIGDRLQLISARGKKGFRGRACVEWISRKAKEIGAEVIMLDPLYKISEGVENATEDFKTILAHFDEMAEETGAAIIFIHHDKKGVSGDSQIIDRGAGSGVLGRDFDASIVLTPHSSEKHVTVVDVVTRNYPPQDTFSIAWYYGEGGVRFNLAEDIAPSKKTSKEAKPKTPLEDYLPKARTILGRNGMPMGTFKVALMETANISRDRVRDFCRLFVDSDDPRITVDESRGKGKGTKKIVRWNEIQV
jgi:hypothetical protein